MHPRFGGRRLAWGVAAVMIVGAIFGGCGDAKSGTSTTPSAAAKSGAALPGGAMTRQALVLHDDMRKLWEDHVTWTRFFIVCSVSGLPDTQPTADRLLRNQTDIGNALKPIYGDQSGDKFTALLKEHVATAAEIVAAAKANDKVKADSATARWYANADEIATFLNTANPQHWPVGDLKAALKEHLDLTLAEAQARLKADYPGEIGKYDNAHTQILKVADTLSSGIVAQHPEKFR